jgi:peptidoglycan/LPS O-acetylase OafA/YrhL
MQIYQHSAGLTEKISVLDTAQLWYVPAAVWLLSCAGIALSVRWRPALSPGWQKAIRCLGLMTYPLYLIHFCLGVWLTVQLVRLGMRPAVALFVVIAFLTGVSFAISTWIEPAVRRTLRTVLETGERWFFPVKAAPVEVVLVKT